MSNITIFEEEFDNVAGFKMPDLLGDDVTFTEGGGGSPTLETVTKTYTPTESQQTETITASSGYDGIEEVDVTVNAISSSYVGSGVTRRSSSDLSQSNATITAPAGYYASNATKTMPNADYEVGAVVTKNTNTHVATILPYCFVEGDGYIAENEYDGDTKTVSAADLVSGTYTVNSAGTVSVTNYASVSVPSGSATTPATTIDAEPLINFDPDTGEMSITLNKVQSVTPTVSAGYVSSGTAGNITVTGSDSFTLDVVPATTYYPSSTDQTIIGDQWLSGAQTIKGVTTTNLTAANIKSGVTVEVGDSSDSDRILSVTGTYTGASNLVHYVIRPDAVLANSYTYDKYMHADEQITMPSYSTSAQTIKASASLGTITLDRDNYYYYIVERMLTIPTYSVTSVAKGRCEFHMGAHVFEIIDIPANTLHSLINPSLLYTSRLNTVTTVLATYRELYYSSGTALATYSTQAYGVCQAAVAPAISSGVVTINSPTVTCRGHSTYYSSTYANALTDVRAQYVIEVYKAPKNSSLGYDGWSNDQLMKQIITAVNSNTQKLT